MWMFLEACLCAHVLKVCLCVHVSWGMFVCARVLERCLCVHVSWSMFVCAHVLEVCLCGCFLEYVCLWSNCVHACLHLTAE